MGGTEDGHWVGWRAQWGGDDSHEETSGNKRPPSDNDTLEFVRPKYRILSSACCMPPQIGIHICREPVSPSKPHPSSLPLHTFPCPRVPRSIQTVVFWIRRRPRRPRLARPSTISTTTHTHTPHQFTRWRYHHMLGQHRRPHWHTLAGGRGPAVGAQRSAAVAPPSPGD